MANYMADVARLLGVEIGEEFELIFQPPSTCHATVMLTTDGTKVINTNVYDVFNFKNYLLEHLIKGTYGIKHKPWKPKMNDMYWFVCTDKSVVWREFERCPLDIYNYKLGNCYRTEEAAIANRDKWISFYTSDEVLEV